jgi:hypothetical protein
MNCLLWHKNCSLAYMNREAIECRFSKQIEVGCPPGIGKDEDSTEQLPYHSNCTIIVVLVSLPISDIEHRGGHHIQAESSA